ncbi:hypothetical protein [Paenibacillus popilliae]|uniref:Predicted O-linked N-acetylglucosamine transferase n=1 Tax=Paenibacillus popilliae ATCC 14706 TaxID=1212764 RepID=M9M7D3_PAEPP|nr:hypothetical protein [Paenibacillus popilliae]GAC43603.1 predicted O-linked N-acetylglucosamine transferase [Paenibacillus popilliae ATCC 14706]
MILKFVLIATLLPTPQVASEDPLSRAILEGRNPIGDNQTVDDTVSIFKGKYKKEVLLPTYIPFKVTHRGGTYDIQNKRIRISYYNSDTKDTLTVSVFYTQDDLEHHVPSKYEKIKLQDGTNAAYIRSRNEYFADYLFFKKEEYEYRLGLILKNSSKKELLLKIASSLEKK